jgi:hypothetical protein
VSKQYWRLLEPGEIMLEWDEWLYPGPVWAPVCSPFVGEPVGAHAAMHVNVVRRRIILPEPQGWISVNERMPMKEDANKQGMVVWWDGLNRNDGDWDDYEEGFTHWSTVIDALEPDRDPDEEAWDFFKGSILHAQPELEKGISWEFEKKVFLAGRKSVATEGGAK